MQSEYRCRCQNSKNDYCLNVRKTTAIVIDRESWKNRRNVKINASSKNADGIHYMINRSEGELARQSRTGGIENKNVNINRLRAGRLWIFRYLNEPICEPCMREIYVEI